MLKTNAETMRKTPKKSSRQISEKLDLKSSQRKDLQDNKENKKHSQVKWKKEEKKNICIVGDSMLKNITGSGLSKDHTVKIRPHPGATTVDMIDYIKPELRHKPDIVILHCGTNDITNDVNTVKKIKKLVKEIEENDGSTDIVISGLIKRFDRNAIDDIERINEKIKRWCLGKGLTFIDNNNINESCLNRGKLHLNRRGSSYLANNFKKFIESL